MEPRFWSVVLVFVMAAAIFLELLTPSMGGFTLGALAAAAGSTFMAFQHSPSFGYLMLAVNLVLFPLLVWVGVNFMKRSPLMLKQELKEGMQTASDAQPLSQLLGQEGTALTPLRPSGSALINNTRVNVVSRGCFVEAQARIKVIRVESNRVVVEPV